MRYGKFPNMMQQQEEDEAQKLMEKEQRVMSSTPTGEALLLIQRVLYLHHFLQSSIPQNLGIASKVTTLATDSMFFFPDPLPLAAKWIFVDNKNYKVGNQKYGGI